MTGPIQVSSAKYQSNKMGKPLEFCPGVFLITVNQEINLINNFIRFKTQNTLILTQLAATYRQGNMGR